MKYGQSQSPSPKPCLVVFHRHLISSTNPRFQNMPTVPKSHEKAKRQEGTKSRESKTDQEKHHSHAQTRLQSRLQTLDPRQWMLRPVFGPHNSTNGRTLLVRTRAYTATLRSSHREFTLAPAPTCRRMWNGRSGGTARRDAKSVPFQHPLDNFPSSPCFIDVPRDIFHCCFCTEEVWYVWVVWRTCERWCND